MYTCMHICIYAYAHVCVYAYICTYTYTRIYIDSVLLCSAVEPIVLCVGFCVSFCCSVLQCDAVCCSVLQCVAVCCGVLQCVAVCCSVLHLHKMHANLCRKGLFVVSDDEMTSRVVYHRVHSVCHRHTVYVIDTQCIAFTHSVRHRHTVPDDEMTSRVV